MSLQVREHKLVLGVSPWELNIQREQYELHPVSKAKLHGVLELDENFFSDHTLDSIYRSDWYVIGDNRIVVEIRNPRIVQPTSPASLVSQSQAGEGVVQFIDFDDCQFSATNWHGAEYTKIATSQALHDRGIFISEKEARHIYGLAKIEIPGKVKHEARYTPDLNFRLLLALAAAREQGLDTESSWQHMITTRDYLISLIGLQGEQSFSNLTTDPDIAQIFVNNSPAEFVYTQFVEDLLFERAPQDQDIRVIATRGKIEGFLGQIYKLHSSLIMDQDVDLVIYSNDIKVESLILLSQIIPWINQMLVRVIDDNPNEIYPYLDLARSRGIPNIEIIRVQHPGDRHRDDVLDIEPDLSFETNGTGFEHYFPMPTVYSLH